MNCQKKPKRLKWKGEFVWAYVNRNDNYEEAKLMGKRQVVAVSEEPHVIFAVKDGASLCGRFTEKIDTWIYAWEIEDEVKK